MITVQPVHAQNIRMILDRLWGRCYTENNLNNRLRKAEMPDFFQTKGNADVSFSEAFGK